MIWKNCEAVFTCYWGFGGVAPRREGKRKTGVKLLLAQQLQGAVAWGETSPLLRFLRFFEVSAGLFYSAAL
jgi:hypothetical protein